MGHKMLHFSHLIWKKSWACSVAAQLVAEDCLSRKPTHRVMPYLHGWLTPMLGFNCTGFKLTYV